MGRPGGPRHPHAKVRLPRRRFGVRADGVHGESDGQHVEDLAHQLQLHLAGQVHPGKEGQLSRVLTTEKVQRVQQQRRLNARHTARGKRRSPVREAAARENVDR